MGRRGKRREVCSQLEVLYSTSGSQTTPPIRNNATFSREPTAAAAYMQPLPFAVLWRSKLMQSDRIGCETRYTWSGCDRLVSAQCVPCVPVVFSGRAVVVIPAEWPLS